MNGHLEHLEHTYLRVVFRVCVCARARARVSVSACVLVCVCVYIKYVRSAEDANLTTIYTHTRTYVSMIQSVWSRGSYAVHVRLSPKNKFKEKKQNR